jgi:hypothetical protein
MNLLGFGSKIYFTVRQIDCPVIPRPSCWLSQQKLSLSKGVRNGAKKSQGCQMFLGTTYQNGKNIPNCHKLNQMATKYVYQMATKYTKWQ